MNESCLLAQPKYATQAPKKEGIALRQGELEKERVRLCGGWAGFLHAYIVFKSTSSHIGSLVCQLLECYSLGIRLKSRRRLVSENMHNCEKSGCLEYQSQCRIVPTCMILRRSHSVVHLKLPCRLPTSNGQPILSPHGPTSGRSDRTGACHTVYNHRFFEESPSVAAAILLPRWTIDNLTARCVQRETTQGNSPCRHLRKAAIMVVQLRGSLHNEGKQASLYPNRGLRTEDLNI